MKNQASFSLVCGASRKNKTRNHEGENCYFKMRFSWGTPCNLWWITNRIALRRIDAHLSIIANLVQKTCSTLAPCQKQNKLFLKENNTIQNFILSSQFLTCKIQPLVKNHEVYKYIKLIKSQGTVNIRTKPKRNTDSEIRRHILNKNTKICLIFSRNYKWRIKKRQNLKIAYN